MRVLIASTLLVCSACTCGKMDVLDDGGAAGGGTGGSSTGGGSGGSTGGGSGGGVSGTGGGTVTCIPGATSLTVAPTDPTQMSLAPITFTVTANGTNVTSQVRCTAARNDDTPPGAFSGATFTPAAAGVITITCTDSCVSGSSTVTIQGGTQTFDGDAGTVTTTRFMGTVVMNDATKSPVWVYPNDNTIFPRNIYKQLFQWQGKGNDYFRLTFTGPNSTVVVYTNGIDSQCAATATAGCHETDAAQWLAIAGGNAGEQVTVTVDGVRPADTNVYRSTTTLHIRFSKRDVRGAIFYWSTTAAGIRRASVSDMAPEAYIVAKPVGTVLPGNGTVKCVACHTVSRSGKKIIGFTQAATTGEFVYNVTNQPPPAVAITTQISTAKGFGTFSPDDLYVVATSGNVLAQFDANDGGRLVTLPPAAGTNPDWSPLGNVLAFSNKSGDSPGTADLQLIDRTGTTSWGTARTLVPAAGFTNLFPSFSPSGAHIAYARGKGGHGDKTFQLWLAAIDGGTPVELVNANRLVSNATTLGQHENNMPTWAPPGDYDWVAFNSVRQYGVVFPAGGKQQIWVAAIDRSKLDQGIDPSAPAFRFSFQGLTEDNHRAFWTLDVRYDYDAGPPPDAGFPPPDAGSCLMTDQMCDQTSGPLCCGLFDVCDTGQSDGGGGMQTYCRPIIIN